MNGLDNWDLVLLGIAVLGAAWKLVALMGARRDRLVAEVQQQLEVQRAAMERAAAEKKKQEAAA